MNARTLTRLQETSLASGREADYLLGESVIGLFYMNVSRSRDRYLLYWGDFHVGYMDMVVPFPIFKSPYEVFYPHFSTTTPFDYDDISWEPDPYQSDDQPQRYFPATQNPETALKFLEEKVFPALGIKD